MSENYLPAPPVQPHFLSYSPLPLPSATRGYCRLRGSGERIFLLGNDLSYPDIKFFPQALSLPERRIAFVTSCMSSLKVSLDLFHGETQGAASRQAGRRKKMDKDIMTTSSVSVSTSTLARHASHSRPIGTGSGKEVMTQVVYTIDYLKSRTKPASFDDIWGHLSIPASQQHSAILRRALIEHPRVDYDPQALDGHSSFCFCPKYNIRSANDLMDYLKRHTTAQYVSVKELEEGWPTAAAEIEALECNGELLLRRVVRNKQKDILVWLNDPALTVLIDQDFQDYWHSIKLPSNSSDMRLELEEAGLTPTSQINHVVKFSSAKSKKRKTSRKISRTTNVHMDGILQDYSQVME